MTLLPWVLIGMIDGEPKIAQTFQTEAECRRAVAIIELAATEPQRSAPKGCYELKANAPESPYENSPG